MPELNDFDRYVAEHGVPREHYPAEHIYLYDLSNDP